MTAKILLIGLIALVGISNCQVGSLNPVGASLADYVQPCNRADPHVNECIHRTLQHLLSNFGKGSPELTQFDPVHYDIVRFRFNDNPLSPLSWALAENVDVFGLSTAQVLAVKTQFTNNTMEAVVKIQIPKITFGGSFRTKSKYWFIPFMPRGTFNAETNGVTATVTWFSRTESRNGDIFMRVQDFDYEVNDLNGLRIRVNGLFNSKFLTDFAIRTVIDNWRIMWNLFLKNVWETRMQEIMNSFYGAIPYRRLIV